MYKTELKITIMNMLQNLKKDMKKMSEDYKTPFNWVIKITQGKKNRN